jgi:hypothetical protein
MHQLFSSAIHLTTLSLANAGAAKAAVATKAPANTLLRIALPPFKVLATLAAAKSSASPVFLGTFSRIIFPGDRPDFLADS